MSCLTLIKPKAISTGLLYKWSKVPIRLASNYKSVSLPDKLPLEATNVPNDESYDSYVIIANDLETDLKKLNLNNQLDSLLPIKQNHKEFEKDLTFVLSNNKRLIYSPTGPLNRDYDDVRQIADATTKALKKAIQIGSKKPLLINALKGSFKYADQVSLLAALEASYTPLEVREHKKQEELLKIEKLGFWHQDLSDASKIVNIVNGIEIGRIACRDIGGSDPERMTPPNVHAYVNDMFKSTDIKVSSIEGQEEFLKNYPAFAAVNRAADVVKRHQGRIVKLEYNPSGDKPIDETLFLIGKGMTYDTGGADIKHGGNMTSMHRDKCGAAFVAGFFKTLSILKPQGLKAHGVLCLTRNNVGEECYVTDEIITARSGKRIRVGNTDAEGRMAICDSLCEAKDNALNEKNPKLFTIATLTGHVVMSYGTKYTGIMSNGLARKQEIDKKLQESGHEIADPFEISTIRREDFKNYKGTTEYEDITQISNKPSARSRGHQGPGAFLIMASGLDKHGVDSKNPLPYTHVDIAGSSGEFPGLPSAAPLPSFAMEYIYPRIK